MVWMIYTTLITTKNIYFYSSAGAVGEMVEIQ